MARPNKKGDGKKGGGKGKNRNRFYNRATTNVELQDQSQVNLLNQQLQQAQQDYLREQQAAMSVYGGAGEEIRDLPRPQFDQIGDQYTQALSSIAPLFAGEQGMPGSETAAGNALGMAYGESGQTMLTNMAAREGMARSSAAREANLSGRYAQDALIQRMEDTMQSYNDQLGQVRADDPWQIKQEVGDLRQQSLENRLLKQKMASDRAFSEWLQGYVGGAGSGRPGRPGGGGGGGGTPDPGRPGPADNGAYNVGDPLDIHGGHQVRGGGGGYAPGSSSYNPTIRDWRQGDARWGQLSQGERGRIRRRGLSKFPVTMTPQREGGTVYPAPPTSPWSDDFPFRNPGA